MVALSLWGLLELLAWLESGSSQMPTIATVNSNNSSSQLQNKQSQYPAREFCDTKRERERGRQKNPQILFD